jgi:2-dehydro-3-deoxygluconokinase
VNTYFEEVEYVTRLPKNELGDACLMSLRGYGIHTEHIARGGDRIGIYFLETSAAQRGSKVIYERANSSVASIQTSLIDWEKCSKEPIGSTGQVSCLSFQRARRRSAAKRSRLRVE